MEKKLSIFNIFHFQLRILVVVVGISTPILSFSQTEFYNEDAVITVDPTTILYVDGNITNTSLGLIHNQGDIYLTGDWSNDQPSGCLDPNTGTVILKGTSQLIKGAQPTTFNNLDCQTTGTKKLAIDATVGGTTGTLSLQSSPFDLNKHTLTFTNNTPSAITSTGGYIVSETDPTVGYGKVNWELGTTINNYSIPFGTVTGASIPFTLNVTAVGTNTGTGSISIATYPTNVTATPNNRPLPAGVGDLNDGNGIETAPTCADRYLITSASNFSVNPTVDMSFTYLESEWDGTGGSTNNVPVEDSLQAWMWNGTQWQNPTVGTLNAVTNTASVTGINTFSAWTLKVRGPIIPFDCSTLDVPNAFSPNNDGHNDLFVLHKWAGCVSDFSFLVFDRWGEKVYESEDASRSWDGIYKGKQLEAGVYVYYINATTSAGTKIAKKGNISLIR